MRHHRTWTHRARALSTVGATALGAALAGVAGWAPAAAEEAASDDRIVITGSRIARRDFIAQSPLVTVGAETFENTSDVSIDQQLFRLPQFGAGTNQATSADATQASPTDTPGISTANLRGLGTNRTLVLVDGRRTQPANAALVVDLNSIPVAALESVEIITGGAAATYGADAVAGVVNFILRDDFEGVALDAQHGITSQGDGAQTSLSALIGGNFDSGDGNAMLGLSYSRREAVFQADRDFFANAWLDPNIATGTFVGHPGWSSNLPGRPDLTNGGRPTQDSVDDYFTGLGFPAGDVPNTAVLYFNTAPNIEDVSLFSVNAGAISGTPTVNYQGPLFPDYKVLANGSLDTSPNDNMLSLPLERFSMFARANYEVNEFIDFYGQGSFTQGYFETQGNVVPAVLQYAVEVPRDDDHPVPDALAAILDSRDDPDAPWILENMLNWLGPERFETTTNTYEMVFGARGELGISDWTYDAFWSQGKTYLVTEFDGYADLNRYQALISLPNYGVVDDPVTGVLTNFRLGRAASCQTGLNPFLSTPVSQDCKDIVNQTVKSSTDVVQDQVELNIEGHMFDLPAGEARFAAGVAWRNNNFEFKPSAALSSTNITSHTLGLADTTPTGGKVEVGEIYGEVLVPLVADAPFADSISINAGYRYSDYNTSGGTDTWKLTGDWVVNDTLMFRGGYQVATRAPNVAELFLPPTFLTVAWPDHDPCSSLTVAPYGNNPANPDRAQVQALCAGISGFPGFDDDYIGNVPFFFPLARDMLIGNPDLDPETADTWTFGAVINSPFDVDGLRNLIVAVDYYDISITDAVEVFGSPLVYRDCFNADGMSNPTYDPNYVGCEPAIRSDADGRWLATVARYANLGLVETSGVDVQAQWNAELGSNIAGQPAAVFANVAFNYLNSYDVQTVAGADILDYRDSSDSPNGVQFPWKLYSTVGLDVGPAQVSLGWRHLPEVRNVALVTNPASTAVATDAYDQFDLSTRWSLNGNFELRAGVDNLFDAEPPRVGIVPGQTSAAGMTDPATYDVLGQRFYVGVGARF